MYLLYPTPLARMPRVKLHSLMPLHKQNTDGNLYFCLEDYKPIGTVLKQVPVGGGSQAAAAAASTRPKVNNTSGQVARQCAAACDATHACSGFRAVGPEVVSGASCHLLANSTAALPEALALEPGNPWPQVNANLTSFDNIALRSISWMCWRQQEDWDMFGKATHDVITTGSVEGECRVVVGF